MWQKITQRLRGLCLRFAHTPVIGRSARRLARLGLPPHTGCVPLAHMRRAGYISPDAVVHHSQFKRGERCFVGDGVMIYEEGSGSITLGERVHIYQNNMLQTGEGGSIEIGDRTHVQPRCQFTAYLGKIRIGRQVEIAPACAFYPYNHSMKPGTPVQEQPLHAKTGIEIGDYAWLGYGVTVLDGARIGEGAVIAAGAVVSSEIPPNAIAAGVPARVIGERS